MYLVFVTITVVITREERSRKVNNCNNDLAVFCLCFLFFHPAKTFISDQYWTLF